MSTKKRRSWVLLIAGGFLVLNSCYQTEEYPLLGERQATPQELDDQSVEDQYKTQRTVMVERQLKLRDISDKDVLEAMLAVARHEFVPEDYREYAYSDQPLPIGHDQTISQPYIVALMTQLAQIKPDSKVLDIGTGSGYQAAVLAKLAKQVYSIEIVEPLADEARERLRRLKYDNVEVRAGDGYAGWPEHAPFDAIIVAAAPDHVPPKLVEQLAPGARMVIPIGPFRKTQRLIVVEKQADGSAKEWTVTAVAFVPMTGEAQKKN